MSQYFKNWHINFVSSWSLLLILLELSDNISTQILWQSSFIEANWAWLCTLVILAPKGQEQEMELEATLNHVARPCLKTKQRKKKI